MMEKEAKLSMPLASAVVITQSQKQTVDDVVHDVSTNVSKGKVTNLDDVVAVMNDSATCTNKITRHAADVDASSQRQLEASMTPTDDNVVVDPNHEGVAKSESALLNDDEIKKQSRMMNGSCHAVTLVVGEYVEEPNIVNNTAATLPVTTGTTAVNSNGIDAVMNDSATNTNEVITHEANVDISSQLQPETSMTPSDPNALPNCEGVAEGTRQSESVLHDDNEIKKRSLMMDGSCHAVALVVGEYVETPNIVNSAPTLPFTTNTTALLPVTSNNTAINGNTIGTSRREHKVRSNTDNTEDERIPGAFRVRGIKGSSSFRSSYKQESSRFMDDFEDSQQILFKTDGELSPMELLERAEAVTVHETEAKAPLDTVPVPPLFSIKNRKCQLLLGVIFLIIVAVIGIVVRGNYNKENVPIDLPVVDIQTKKYQAFHKKEELVAAVDEFISGQTNNKTPSLVETYGHISDWNVSLIQDFSHVFDVLNRNNLLRKFNEDLSRWDVSSATNMSWMFHGALEFCGDLSDWNVSRVTDMQYFVAEVPNFNCNLSKWDTSNFLNTSYMFYLAGSFLGIGLEYWNVSRIQDMQGMFFSSRSFRGNIARWDVSNVQDMSHMFRWANKFDCDLTLWNVSNVRKMYGMFTSATSFQGVGVENWDTSKVQNMSYMFENAIVFDANLSKWSISKVKDTSSMFAYASSYQGAGVGNWDTSNIVTMESMFYWAPFDADLSKWNTSKVHDTTSMFENATSFRGAGVENWNTSKMVSLSRMFQFATNFDANLSLWDISEAVDASYMFAGNFMFAGASSFQGIGVENWDTSNIETMSGMFAFAESFDANLSKWNISKVKDLSSMFYLASSFDANLSSWDVGRVVDMSFLFGGAASFRGNGLEYWNTSSVQNMFAAFAQVTSLNANLSKWDVSRVRDMSLMFYNATSFRGDGLDVWNVHQVDTTNGMFAFATAFNANLSNWDVASVRDMSYMFHQATSFRGYGLDVWNVNQVNNTFRMFESAISFNANLSRWDISNVENATFMFENATSFEGVFWWNDTSDAII